MRDFLIRDAVAKDVKPVAELHVAAWRLAYEPILAQEHLDWVSVQREVRRKRALLKDRTPFLVAEKAGEAVGFLVYGDESDDVTGAVTAKSIDSFWVHQNLTRQGIGQKLLQEVIRRESPSRIYVWVLTGVEAGPAFYEKNGFRPEEKTRQDFVFLGHRMPMVRYCKRVQTGTKSRKKK